MRWTNLIRFLYIRFFTRSSIKTRSKRVIGGKDTYRDVPNVIIPRRTSLSPPLRRSRPEEDAGKLIGILETSPSRILLLQEGFPKHFTDSWIHQEKWACFFLFRFLIAIWLRVGQCNGRNPGGKTELGFYFRNDSLKKKSAPSNVWKQIIL